MAVATRANRGSICRSSGLTLVAWAHRKLLSRKILMARLLAVKSMIKMQSMINGERRGEHDDSEHR
jgi:hypothetical protein